MELIKLIASETIGVKNPGPKKKGKVDGSENEPLYLPPGSPLEVDKETADWLLAKGAARLPFAEGGADMPPSA